MRRTFIVPALLLLAASPAAAQGTIRPGERVAGELAVSDPTMQDGTHYDVWRFSGEASHRYRVTLHSADFDAFLTVGADSRPGCDDCSTDDDGGGGTDAQVEYWGTENGMYEIRAYSYDEGATGRYELVLEDQGMHEEHVDSVLAGTPIGLGEVSGELARGDPKSGHSYSDTWTYQGRAGEIIRVTLRSQDFDALLAMGAYDGAECTGMDSDDDSAGGTDARLTMRLPADGAYHFHVSSAQVGGDGAYTLTVEQEEEVVAVASPVADGETMEGSLGDGDAREPSDGSFFDLWSLRGSAGETLTITMRSEDFDTYLHFGRTVDGRWEVLETNDDGGEGTDSELTVTLPETGEYQIHANAFLGGGTGRYTLRVDRR